MGIRNAKENDLLFLKRLVFQLGYPEQDERVIQEKIKAHDQQDYRLLVVEKDKEVVAFIALHWFDLLHLVGRIGRITAFCVDERFRSQGIGIQLLEAAEDVLQTEGCTKIEVTSNIKRTLTHEFYLKRGYREDSKRFVKYL